MSEYCKHGKRLLSQPTRKCNDCDNEEEIQSLTAEREALRKQRDELREACDNAANTIEALDEFNGSELQINKLRRLATGGE